MQDGIRFSKRTPREDKYISTPDCIRIDLRDPPSGSNGSDLGTWDYFGIFSPYLGNTWYPPGPVEGPDPRFQVGLDTPPNHPSLEWN